MKKIFILLMLGLIASCTPKPGLEDQINKLIADKKAKVGIAVMEMKNGKLTTVNGNDFFPLQSVFKYHVAAKVLDEVDKGTFKINQKIEVKDSEILPDTYSPMRDKYGITDLSIGLDELIYYMVSTSDNNACDILLARIGGPKAVEDYFHGLGISDLKIEVNEAEMHSDDQAQYKNITTPIAMATALKNYYQGKYLSGDSHNFLWAMMSNTETGKDRIKAGVTKGCTVTHKTGTSGRNQEGISSATNDVGIITMPDGRAVILVVFVSESSESDAENEKIIADVTKLVMKSL